MRQHLTRLLTCALPVALLLSGCGTSLAGLVDGGNTELLAGGKATYRTLSPTGACGGEFDFLDENGDGALSLVEFRQSMRPRRLPSSGGSGSWCVLPPAPSAIEAAFEKHDADQSGDLSRDEYCGSEG